jgi:hypothetical protein
MSLDVAERRIYVNMLARRIEEENRLNESLHEQLRG